MRQLFHIIVLFFCYQTLCSQNKTEIDSLNDINTQNREISTDSLLKIYQGNLNNAQKLNYQKGIAGSYWQLSVIHGYQGNMAESIDLMLKAIRIYEKVGDIEKVADSYGELGYKMKRDDIEKAQYYMNKGLKLAEAKQFRKVMGRIYNNYGILKEMQGQLDSAKLFFEKGLKIVLEDNYKTGIPYSYSNLAGVYGLTGQLDSARYYFNKARELREEIGDTKGIAENYTQIGEVFLQENRPRAAIRNFKQSLPLAREENYRFLIQYTYQQLSDAYKMRKQTDSALYYLERHNAFKDSIQNLEVQEKIAELNIEFETEKKEKEILAHKTQLAENKLQIQRRNFMILGILVLLMMGSLLAYLIINRQKIEKRQLAQEKELEVALARLETRDKLEKQRLKISRDLHDNIGSQLTFITTSLDNLKSRVGDSKEHFGEKIEQIRIFTSNTIKELRDTIWAMNKESISVNELVNRIAELVSAVQDMNPDIQYQFNTSGNLTGEEHFSALEGINIFRIMQEALNNSTKYSSSTKIHISIVGDTEQFVFEILDFGKGINGTQNINGNGIPNMKKRAHEAKADFILKFSDKGTQIRVIKKKCSIG